MATATTDRWQAMAIAVVLTAFFAACGAGGPQRDGAGRIAKGGETRLLDLRVGDCVGDMTASLDEPDGGHNGDLQVTAVPCSASHDAEVLRVSRIGEGEWPGSHIVDGEAAGGRVELRDGLARIKAAASPQRLKLFTFRPTQDRWEFEDQREIVYLVLYGQPRRGPAPP